MASKGGQPGNKNASKAFKDALRLALARRDRDKPEEQRTLAVLAGQLIDEAIGGDKFSRIELIDRIDGKAHQSVAMDVEVTGKRSKDMSIGELQRAIADEIARTREASTGEGEPAQVH